MGTQPGKSAESEIRTRNQPPRRSKAVGAVVAQLEPWMLRRPGTPAWKMERLGRGASWLPAMPATPVQRRPDSVPIPLSLENASSRPDRRRRPGSPSTNRADLRVYRGSDWPCEMLCAAQNAPTAQPTPLTRATSIHPTEFQGFFIAPRFCATSTICSKLRSRKILEPVVTDISRSGKLPRPLPRRSPARNDQESGSSDAKHKPGTSAELPERKARRPGLEPLARSQRLTGDTHRLPQPAHSSRGQVETLKKAAASKKSASQTKKSTCQGRSRRPARTAQSPQQHGHQKCSPCCLRIRWREKSQQEAASEAGSELPDHLESQSPPLEGRSTGRLTRGVEKIAWRRPLGLAPALRRPPPPPVLEPFIGR